MGGRRVGGRISAVYVGGEANLVKPDSNPSPSNPVSILSQFKGIKGNGSGNTDRQGQWWGKNGGE